DAAARRRAPRGAPPGDASAGGTPPRGHPRPGGGYPCGSHGGGAAQRGLGGDADRGRESTRRRAPGAARRGRKGPPGGGAFRERLAVKEMTAEQRADLVQQLAKLARGAAGQDFLAERLSAGETSSPARQMILRAMARAGLKQAPARWLDVLIPTLTRGDPEVI